MKKVQLKGIQYIILFVVTVLLNVVTVFGQQNNLYTTKIKDGTVANSAQTAAPATLLELESSSKGFLLPRMTTAERNAISITDKERGNGLAIYNKETDCINYWSSVGDRWLSLCGTLPPAIIDLSACDRILLNASGNNYLEQGKFLRNTDVLYIQVNVRESGSYTITANTSNGYSFSNSGTFNAAGVYTIALEGLGTPMEGNATPGDLVTFMINGKVSSTCSSFRIKVEPSDLNYTIDEPQRVAATWDAFIGVPLNANVNTMKIAVDVTSVGFWRVQSETVNGMSFGGSGEFTAKGKQEIEIVGQGVPIESTPTSSPSTFTFTTNSVTNSAPKNAVVTVQVKPVAYEVLCDDTLYKIEVRGEYKEDTMLSSNNTILLPIKVLAPGKADIVLNGYFVVGSTTVPVSFKAKGVNITFNAQKDNVQYVTLYPDEIRIPKGATTLKFTNTSPNNVAVCASFPETSIAVQPIRYSVLCNTVSLQGVYIVETPLDEGQHYITLKVNVAYAGEYSITTNEVDGVSFSASGVFSSNGEQTIRLLPKGRYTTGGSYVYVITTNSQAGTTTCSVLIEVRYREIVVLRLGSAYYGPFTSNAYAGGAILNSRINFGPKGKVKVQNVRILGTGVQGEALRTYIRNNKVDIIVNVIGYNATSATNNVLLDFVRNEKGVLIIGDENTAHTYSKDFIEALTSSSGITTSARFSMINPVVSSANNDPIINGPFGNLSGKYLGNDASNGWYYGNLPKDIIPLIQHNDDASWTWGLKHKDLGFAFIGDGGWIIGTQNDARTAVWPSRYLADGTPVGKPYYQGTEVFNSVLYANMMAWAIEYVKENKKNN